jgi:hypothetical protein
MAIHVGSLKQVLSICSFQVFHECRKSFEFVAVHAKAGFEDSVERRLGCSPEFTEAATCGYVLNFRVPALSANRKPNLLR